MRKIAIFMFSHSTTIAKPWAQAGIDCYMFDVKHGEDHGKMNTQYKGTIYTYGGNIQDNRKLLGELCRKNKVLLIGAFPPCTDVAFVGGGWFEKKALKDAFFWAKSMELFYHAVFLADFYNIPYFAENPKTMIMHLYKRPDFRFNPCDYGGYLSKKHQHRYFPHIYPGRDSYNKETWIWCGNGFKIPKKKRIEPIAKQFPGSKLWGNYEKTQEIKCVTPEGFSQAVFKANWKK